MAITPKKVGAGKRAAELFTAAGGTPAERRNIVLRLMHGEFSLTVTFWIGFVSIPLLGHLLFSRLLFPLLDVRTWYGSTAFVLWALLAVLYGAVVCLGLWRSRTRFTGKAVWAQLAALAAVLGMAGFLAYAAVMAGSWLMLSGL